MSRTPYQEGIWFFYAIKRGVGFDQPRVDDVAAMRDGYDAAAETSKFLPKATPNWILEFLGETPHGGWVHPIALDERHPLVADDPWKCFHCEKPCKAGDVVIIMPFNDQNDARWVVYHRPCCLSLMGLLDPV